MRFTLPHRNFPTLPLKVMHIPQTQPHCVFWYYLNWAIVSHFVTLFYGWLRFFFFFFERWEGEETGRDRSEVGRMEALNWYELIQIFLFLHMIQGWLPVSLLLTLLIYISAVVFNFTLFFLFVCFCFLLLNAQLRIILKTKVFWLLQSLSLLELSTCQGCLVAAVVWEAQQRKDCCCFL